MNPSIRCLLPYCASVPLDPPTKAELVLQRQSNAVYTCYHWNAGVGVQRDRRWNEHHTDQDGQHDLGFRLQLGVPQRLECMIGSRLWFTHILLTLLQSMIGNYGTMVSNDRIRVGSCG